MLTFEDIVIITDDTDQVHLSCLTTCVGVELTIKGWSDDYWEQFVAPHNSTPGIESRMHWFNHCCHAVSHVPWSADEEARLVSLVQHNKKFQVKNSCVYCEKSFNVISCDISAYQGCTRPCSLRMCTLDWKHLDPSGRLQGPLSSLSESSYAKSQSPEPHGMQMQWEQLAADLNTGRSAVACMMHYKAIEQRTRGQGRFSPEEEARIEEAVRRFGPNWPEVAAHCGGGRNRQQVMHHYKNTMKPSRKGKWLPEEDELLLRVVTQSCMSMLESACYETQRCSSTNMCCARFDNNK